MENKYIVVGNLRNRENISEGFVERIENFTVTDEGWECDGILYRSLLEHVRYNKSTGELRGSTSGLVGRFNTYEIIGRRTLLRRCNNYIEARRHNIYTSYYYNIEVGHSRRRTVREGV